MDNITRFTLRIPKELNEWLEEQARLHHRSKHQEVVNILTLTKARCETMGKSLQDERWVAMTDRREK